MTLTNAQVELLRASARLPPATRTACDRAERVLGVPLPAILRSLYLTVGNGGFGPGYGILGLEGGATDDLGQTALDVYESFMLPDPDAAVAEPWWREAHLPLCYWGCIVYSVVDCRTPDAKIVGFDEGTWVEDGRPLDRWLQDWLDDCEMQQPIPGQRH